jgi:hypothetical protein
MQYHGYAILRIVTLPELWLSRLLPILLARYVQQAAELTGNPGYLSPTTS